MDSVQARLISMSKDKRYAQVVVCLGEGPQRRSVTRHILLEGEGYLWGVGRNPDKAALAQLDAAERVLEKAQRHHEFLVESIAKISIKEIEGFLTRVRRCREKVSELPPVFRDAVEKALLADQETNAETVKAVLKRGVARSAALLRAATKQAEELRESIPREVSFNFGTD